MTSTRLAVAALALSLLAALLVVFFLLRPAPPDPFPQEPHDARNEGRGHVREPDDPHRRGPPPGSSMPEPVDLGPLEIRLDNLERQVDQARVDIEAACTAILVPVRAGQPGTGDAGGAGVLIAERPPDRPGGRLAARPRSEWTEQPPSKRKVAGSNPSPGAPPLPIALRKHGLRRHGRATRVGPHAR